MKCSGQGDYPVVDTAGQRLGWICERCETRLRRRRILWHRVTGR
ncbi:MAG: hypothetical protein ABW033_10880 [Acidimicrobiia bacterium]